MIRGAPDDVPLLDRLIARLEVSRLATVPFSLSILSVWPLFLLLWGFQALSDIRSVVPVIVVAAGWCVLAGLDVTRNIWTMRHPYASPRWLRSVHAAVGDDLAVRALACLIRRYDHEPDYVVKRSDMMIAIQIERKERREAARRAEGFRLVEALGTTKPDPQGAGRRRTMSSHPRAACRQVGGEGPVTDGVVLGISGWFTLHGELYHEEGRSIDEIAGADWTTLLDHADSIGFFTRPEPQRPAPDARIFHVTITSGDRSRELSVNDPFEAPELAMLIRLTRRAMRDRLVLTPDMLSEQQLEAIRTAVVPPRAGDDEAADQGT